jgi:hypothetical protein
MSDYHKKYPINMTPEERKEYWAAQHRKYTLKKKEKERYNELQKYFFLLHQLLPIIDPYFSDENNLELDPDLVKKTLRNIKGLTECLQQLQLNHSFNLEKSNATTNNQINHSFNLEKLNATTNNQINHSFNLEKSDATTNNQINQKIKIQLKT